MKSETFFQLTGVMSASHNPGQDKSIVDQSNDLVNTLLSLTHTFKHQIDWKKHLSCQLDYNTFLTLDCVWQS